MRCRQPARGVCAAALIVRAASTPAYRIGQQREVVVYRLVAVGVVEEKAFGKQVFKVRAAPAAARACTG